MSGGVEQRVSQLSTVRQAIYRAGLRGGLDPERAYQAAAARCCNPTGGAQHTAACAAGRNT